MSASLEDTLTPDAATAPSRRDSDGASAPAEKLPPEVRAAMELAARYRLPYVDLLPPDGDSPIDYTLLGEIPVELMVRNQFVPLRREGRRLHLAMADPSDLEKIDELASSLHARIVPHVATAGAIDVVLRKGDATQRVLQEATSSFRISLVKETEHGEEVLDLDRLATDSEMSPIIKLVDTVIFNAMESRASDIHIETRDTAVHVKYRIDGALYEKVEPIDIQHHQTLISRIKVMSELDIAERRIPQDGRFRVRYKGRNVDFRVSIMPTIHGEDSVIRILDKEQINEEFRNLNLDVVGFLPKDLQDFRRYIMEPYGMVLVTGPTGSGKTTTLYSALSKVNNIDVNIMTAEDPVEYNLYGINQVLVRNEIGMTFAAALKAFLRQDPNIIMVGEIRDLETGGIAIKAALTGHLVLSTLHTNDAPSAITRLSEMEIEPFLTASAVVAVVAQRLVRQLCTYCKSRTMLSVSSLEKAGFNVAFDLEAYEPVGCGRCGGSGYKGRTGLYEVMVVSDEIRDQTVERASSEDIRKTAIAQGMRPLRADGFEKVKNGVTSIAEVARVTSS